MSTTPRMTPEQWRIAAEYLAHLRDLQNAAEAPEPLPEHRAAVLALLRARGVLPPADDGGDGGDGEQGGC